MRARSRGTLLAPAFLAGRMSRPWRRLSMNWDIVKGKWKQMKGEARKQWGKLTDDDWDQVAGEKDKFIGKLQERYGWSQEEAERSAKEYFDRQS
jgi:uncharacterized protein YjbJ (UPF0337 family)